MTSVLTPGGEVAAFRLTPRHVHVYSNSTRLAVVRCEEEISAHCIETESHESWSLWLCSDVGRIYSLSRSDLTNPTWNQRADVNQDIFDTLLATQAANKQTHNPEKEAKLTVDIVITLAVKDAKIQLSSGLTSICSDAGLLCFCFRDYCCSKTNYTISVYKSKDLMISGEAGSVNPLLVKSVSFKELEAGPNHCAGKDVESTVFLLSEQSVKPSEETDRSCFGEMFDALFGVGSSLLATSVMLLAVPSGVVFYYKFKDLHHSEEQGPNILCNIDQPVHTIHTFTTSCHSNDGQFGLDSPFPGSSQSEESSHSCLTCMAVIGYYGKCTLIYQSGEQIQYQTVIVPGPIVSSFCIDNTIYISTNQELFRCAFGLFKTADGQKKFKVSSVCLGYSGILGISGTPGSTLGSTTLLCLSQTGRLYTIKDEGQNSSPRNVPGQMKDLLLSISRTAEDIDRTKSIISKQNDVLGQLSIASRLAALSSKGSSSSDNASKVKKIAKNFKVVVLAKQTGIGSRKDFSVCVTLQNRCRVELTGDWGLMVRLKHFKGTKYELIAAAVSKSLPLLGGFVPDSTEEIEIPLDGEKLKTLLFQVSTFLVYRVPSTGFEDPTDKSPRLSSFVGYQTENGDKYPALCVHVNETKLNVLDFLCADKFPVPKSSCYKTSNLCSFSDIAESLSQQRPASQLYPLDLPTKTPVASSLHSLVIHLGARELLKIKKCVDCPDVLRFILSFTSLDGSDDSHTATALVRVSTPTRHHVTLSVTSNQSPSSADLIGYKLTIQGEDMATLVLMKSAFQERLAQKTSAFSSDSDSGVPEKRVRDLLHSVQIIEKTGDGVAVGIDASFRKGDASRSAEQRCKSVYEQLRNIPLTY